MVGSSERVIPETVSFRGGWPVMNRLNPGSSKMASQLQAVPKMESAKFF